MNFLSPREDRTAGALLGLAVGDALGAPWEFMEPRDVQKANPSGVAKYSAGGPYHVRPGQGTDDTELALLTAESLAAHQRLEMADIAARLVAWGKRQVSLGPSTGTGLKALEAGTPPHLAGNTASASSGCLPRCAPLALVYRGSELDQLSLTCCRPTHRHPLALASVIALNRLLAGLIAGLPWQDALKTLEKPVLSEPVVNLSPVRQALTGGYSEPGALDVLAEGVRCFAAAGGPADALSQAVLMGGDTDTRGAVAGALAGARWGASVFPHSLIDPCEQSRFCLQMGSVLAGMAAGGAGSELNSKYQKSEGVV